MTMQFKYFNAFHEISHQLNKLGITPLLMGSVRLTYLTGVDWQAGDLDIHVPGDPRGWDAPEVDRIYQREAIITTMEELGYQLIDAHEHEFTNGVVSVEIGVIDTLPEFADIPLVEISLHSIDGVNFYLPDYRQYLMIYEASYQDSYRVEQNNHKDLQKIAYLRQALSSE